MNVSSVLEGYYGDVAKRSVTGIHVGGRRAHDNSMSVNVILVGGVTF